MLMTRESIVWYMVVMIVIVSKVNVRDDEIVRYKITEICE